MTSCELVTLISTLACAISETYTEEEIEIIATILTQLGDTLVTILAHNSICKSKN